MTSAPVNLPLFSQQLTTSLWPQCALQDAVKGIYILYNEFTNRNHLGAPPLFRGMWARLPTPPMGAEARISPALAPPLFGGM